MTATIIDGVEIGSKVRAGWKLLEWISIARLLGVGPPRRRELRVGVAQRGTQAFLDDRVIERHRQRRAHIREARRVLAGNAALVDRFVRQREVLVYVAGDEPVAITARSQAMRTPESTSSVRSSTKRA